MGVVCISAGKSCDRGTARASASERNARRSSEEEAEPSAAGIGGMPSGTGGISAGKRGGGDGRESAVAAREPFVVAASGVFLSSGTSGRDDRSDFAGAPTGDSVHGSPDTINAVEHLAQRTLLP